MVLDYLANIMKGYGHRMEYFNQCKLEKKLEGGATATQMTFIPNKYAHMHKVLKLKQDDDTWEDGWKVIFVGPKVEEHLVPDIHDSIKTHRKRTGDSLRK